MVNRKPSLDTFGQLIEERRGGTGIRAAAKEVGISPATLSRVENGHLPDLKNFELICRWLGIDPNQVLGFQSIAQNPEESRLTASVHFKKNATTTPETAQSLAQMILRASEALKAQEEL